MAVNLNLPLKKRSRDMARRVIVMDEVLEVIYQWHKGQNNSEIAHSLGVNRKMVKNIFIWLEELALREKKLCQRVMKS